MKMLRKSLSILLVAAMLMSVCTCLLGISVGAYTYSDNRVIALDFDDAKGIANWTANERWSTNTYVSEELRGQLKWGAEFTTDPEDPTNGVFYMWNTAYNSFSAQIGTPDATGVSDDDAFCMENGKTYTLTFKYKFKAGSGSAVSDNGTLRSIAAITMYKGVQVAYTADTAKTGIGNAVNTILHSGDDNVKSLGTYTADTTTLGTYDRLVYENDTEWQVGTIKITGDGTKNNIFFTISAGSGTVVGTNGTNPSFVGLYLDDICITETSGANTAEITEAKSYVYDFKDAAGNVMPISSFGTDGNTGNQNCHAWFSNSHSASGKSYLTEEGAVLYSTQGVPVLYPNAGGSFIHKICLKDPDFQLGNSNTGVKGFLALEAGHIYTITAKVKPYGNSNPATVNVGIGLSQATSAGMSSAYGTLNRITIDGTDTDTWSYITATVDGDDKWTLTSNEVTSEDNVGRVPCVFTSNSATILIESVTVTVAKKADYYSVKSHELDKAAVCAAGSANNLYSDALRKVLNTSTTYDITVTPSATGLQRIPFMTGEYYSKTEYNYINNIILEKGKTYRLELEYAYDATVEGAADITVGWMHTTLASANASVIRDWANGKNIVNEVKKAGTKSDREYLDYTFTADSAADGMYLLLRFSAATTNKGTVTIKNAKVTVMDSDAATPVTFAEEVKRSIRAESNNGSYVSAGIRFRGRLDTAETQNAEEIGFVAIPTQLISNEFEKWFAIDENGKLTNAFAKKVVTTDKIYASGDDYNDYQLIITGLTRENSSANLKNTEFSVVLYVKAADGTYSYHYVEASSYADIRAAYIENDSANADIY